MHGLTWKASANKPLRPLPRNNNQWAVFWETEGNNCATKTVSCHLWKKLHGIWTCFQFLENPVPERWNVAKVYQLCYRSLAEGHAGTSCARSPPWGQNSCQELRHMLLHKQWHRPPTTVQQSFSVTNTEPKHTANVNTTPTSWCTASQNLSDSQVTSGTDGKEQCQQATKLRQVYLIPDFIALRTILVMLTLW